MDNYVSRGELQEIAAEFGTPLLVFSEDRIRANARAMTDAFQGIGDVFYAYKANHLPRLCSIVHDEGIGAEVSSELEYMIARQIGVPAECVIYSGLGRNHSEFSTAIRDGINLINVSSQREVNVVKASAEKYGSTVNVGVRVNCDLEGEEEGRWSIFGVSLDEATEICREVVKSSALNLVGLQNHQLQNESTPDQYGRLLRMMLEHYSYVNNILGTELQVIDLGGGFSSRSSMQRLGYDIDDFAAVYSDMMMNAPNITLYHEPGRYLINDAGFVITRIEERRGNAVIVDVGTNLLVPLQSAEFESVALDEAEDSDLNPFVVKDKLCSSAGIISNEATLPSSIGEGDLLVVRKCGAYTVPLANHWMFPIPGMLLMKDKGYEWLREPETPMSVVDDLLS